jgi:hypothetical protein
MQERLTLLEHAGFLLVFFCVVLNVENFKQTT